MRKKEAQPGAVELTLRGATQSVHDGRPKAVFLDTFDDDDFDSHGIKFTKRAEQMACKHIDGRWKYPEEFPGLQLREERRMYDAANRSASLPLFLQQRSESSGIAMADQQYLRFGGIMAMERSG